MKAHRGDPQGHAEEKKARHRGGMSHAHMLKTGGASRHERKEGGMIPGKGKIDREEEMDVDNRKRGGKVHGEKPKMRADKKARGKTEEKRANGGRMTPKAPLTGAGGAKPPFPVPTMKVDEGGEGKKMAKHALGGTVQEPGDMPKDSQYKRGGRTKRARGGGMMGKKEGESIGAGRSSGGRLSAGERDRLPRDDFALPGKGAGKSGKGSGSYPIPDASHARNALARAAQHASPAEQAAIRRRVHEKFPDIGQS
jgi:hypothetical protein